MKKIICIIWFLLGIILLNSEVQSSNEKNINQADNDQVLIENKEIVSIYPTNNKLEKENSTNAMYLIKKEIKDKNTLDNDQKFEQIQI